MTESAGYSGTPLVRKLGLRPGMRVRLLGEPENYWELLGGSSADLKATLLKRVSTPADFQHLFATDEETLAARFEIARDAMAETGLVWASWPKKASGVESDIGRSDVMKAGKSVGLVDVKICAVDDTWSGLKFVIPVTERS